MKCENIVTSGTIQEIYGVLSAPFEEGSIMINTPYGFITVPVKGVKNYKINQRIEISIQITSHEKDSIIS
jgi:hypothetical protein